MRFPSGILLNAWFLNFEGKHYDNTRISSEGCQRVPVKGWGRSKILVQGIFFRKRTCIGIPRGICLLYKFARWYNYIQGILFVCPGGTICLLQVVQGSTINRTKIVNKERIFCLQENKYKFPQTLHNAILMDLYTPLWIEFVFFVFVCICMYCL